MIQTYIYTSLLYSMLYLSVSLTLGPPCVAVYDRESSESARVQQSPQSSSESPTDCYVVCTSSVCSECSVWRHGLSLSVLVPVKERRTRTSITLRARQPRANRGLQAPFPVDRIEGLHRERATTHVDPDCKGVTDYNCSKYVDYAYRCVYVHVDKDKHSSGLVVVVVVYARQMYGFLPGGRLLLYFGRC